MNDVTADDGSVAGLSLGVVFFGSLWLTVLQGRSFRATGAMVHRQPSAADVYCHNRVLFRLGRSLAAAADLPRWDLRWPGTS